MEQRIADRGRPSGGFGRATDRVDGDMERLVGGVGAEERALRLVEASEARPAECLPRRQRDAPAGADLRGSAHQFAAPAGPEKSAIEAPSGSGPLSTKTRPATRSGARAAASLTIAPPPLWPTRTTSRRSSSLEEAGDVADVGFKADIGAAEGTLGAKAGEIDRQRPVAARGKTRRDLPPRPGANPEPADKNVCSHGPLLLTATLTGRRDNRCQEPCPARPAC